jgi:hypothetical protein
LFFFSCHDEEFELSPDCYKLDNLDYYLEGVPRYNTTVWAITNEGREVELACSWYDAFLYKYQYNCDNYPNLFKDKYIILRSNGTPCKST